MYNSLKFTAHWNLPSSLHQNFPSSNEPASNVMTIPWAHRLQDSHRPASLQFMRTYLSPTERPGLQRTQVALVHDKFTNGNSHLPINHRLHSCVLGLVLFSNIPCVHVTHPQPSCAAYDETKPAQLNGRTQILQSTHLLTDGLSCVLAVTLTLHFSIRKRHTPVPPSQRCCVDKYLKTFCRMSTLEHLPSKKSSLSSFANMYFQCMVLSNSLEKFPVSSWRSSSCDELRDLWLHCDLPVI